MIVETQDALLDRLQAIPWSQETGAQGAVMHVEESLWVMTLELLAAHPSFCIASPTQEPFTVQPVQTLSSAVGKP
jgi:hypothetical protein